MRPLPFPNPPFLAHMRVATSCCWVCGIPFSAYSAITGVTDSASAESGALVHVHHVIPQAAGGTNGPTVTICTHHHDMLHRIAEAWGASKLPLNQRAIPTADTIGLSLDSVNRLAYLARCVDSSLRATANDPNKTAKVSLTLSGEERRMLHAIQDASVPRLSQEAALKRLLHEAYKARFPLL